MKLNYPYFFGRKLKDHIFQAGEVLFHTCEVMKGMADDDIIYGFIKQLLINPTWKYDGVERRVYVHDCADQMGSITITVEGIKGKFNIAGTVAEKGQYHNSRFIT